VRWPALEDAAFWAEVRAGGQGSLSSETELPCADGRAASVLRRIVRLGGTHGPCPATWLVTLRDRSAERGAERERETVLAELRATLESTADGILVTDLRGGIRAFNRRFAALWSLPASALGERDDQRVQDWMLLNVAQPEPYRARLDEIQQQLLMSATDSIALVDGSLLERHTQPQWSHGRPIGRVYSFRELQRRRALQPRRDAGDGLDEWTQLPHRSGFLARLETAVAAARGSGGAMSVLCVEFDADALFGGPQSGPGSHARSLTELAGGLRALLRGPQALARLGGARFGILLEHAGDAAAEALARRLLAQAARLSPAALPTEGLPMVIGVASFPQAGPGAEELLRHAEQAVSRARGSGTTLLVHRFGAAVDSQRQQRLEQALREGLAQPQFRLHYQPRVDPVSGEVQAVEALVRWHDAGHGDLLPAQFLPLAEKAGLAGVLDDWVLEHALRQAVSWREAGLHLPLTVNVCGWQLTQPGYARRVAAVLAHVGWPAQMLEIDVTEAALQLDAEAALAAVRALHQLGVRVVLDDFGAGAACLSLLRRFPLAAVKIDRSLMHGVPRQRGDSAMVAGLIQLAHSLQLAVMIEGVETEAQRHFVADQGCDGWQGFLCAPAMEPARLAQRARAQGGGRLALAATGT